MVTTATLPTLSDAERAFMRPPEELGIADWARRYLRITEGPLIGDGGDPIPWVPELFPLQPTIIEAIESDRWRRVFLLAAPQAFGKTQIAAIPVLLHAIAHRRVAALYVSSSEPLAVKQWRGKIIKALQAHPALTALLPIRTEEIGPRNCRYFTNGTALHFAGSESVGNLSAFTAPVVICDDLQAWPASLPGFGHPADIAWDRAGAFPGEAVTMVGMGTASTTEAYLWQQLSGSAYFCPFVPCLGCGTYQLIEFERFEYPETVEAAVAETYLRCVDDRCGHRITWEELPEMLQRHRWVSVPPGQDWITEPPAGGVGFKDQGTEGRRDGGTKGLRDAEGGPLHYCRGSDPGGSDSAVRVYPETERVTLDAGFWCSALYWPFGDTWGERIADWLGRRGNPDREKHFQQTVRVVPWAEPEADEDALTIAAVAGHAQALHKRGLVPPGADVVTLTADVHNKFLYYIVRAWCLADGTSWLIDAGTEGVHGPHKGDRLGKAEHAARIGHAIAEALHALQTMAGAGFVEMKDGGEVKRTCKLAIALIDSKYRPDAVWQFCVRANSAAGPRVWHMAQGMAGAKRGGPIWPGRATRTRGREYRLTNVDEAKHELRALLAVSPDHPGAWHTYADEPLDAYHRHMVSEHFVPKDAKDPHSPRVWKKRPGAGANHWWDCEVLQIAAAIAVGVKLPSVRGTVRRVRTDWFAKQKKGRRDKGTKGRREW